MPIYASIRVAPTHAYAARLTRHSVPVYYPLHLYEDAEAHLVCRLDHVCFGLVILLLALRRGGTLRCPAPSVTKPP